MRETITFEQIGLILALAAARDQRIVGDADGLAWHSDLNAAGITYADADAALTRFYAVEMACLEPEDRRRVTTPDVIGIARKIRTERLANFVYEPPPGDDDPNYLERLRGQIAAVADGRKLALTELPALEGGPHPTVARALAGVGHQVPGDDEGKPEEKPRFGPLGVDCPVCKVPIGRQCRRGVLGKPRSSPHQARLDVAAGKPAPTAEEREAAAREIEARKAAARAALAQLPAGAVVEPDDGFRSATRPNFQKEA